MATVNNKVQDLMGIRKKVTGKSERQTTSKTTEEREKYIPCEEIK